MSKRNGRADYKNLKNVESFCPVQNTIGIIQAKWTLFILRELLSGTKRFGQLRKSLDGVSPKTLSTRLRGLETAGILSRKVYPEVPLKVEYTLTKKGAKLGDVIQAMNKWGATWMKEGPAPSNIR